MNSSDAIFGVGATQIVVAPGATNAVFIDAGQGREVALLVKYFLGGTLEIQSANPTNGSTQPGASLALNQGYILGTSEVVAIEGPARFYLMATGSTATAMILRGLSTPGYNNFGVA